VTLTIAPDPHSPGALVKLKDEAGFEALLDLLQPHPQAWDSKGAALA
jgi:hypothetical protein